jgi:hypothetical protein
MPRASRPPSARKFENARESGEVGRSRADSRSWELYESHSLLFADLAVQTEGGVPRRVRSSVSCVFENVEKQSQQ